MSKTPKITSQVQSAPEICPCEARSKCTHPCIAVARRDARSHAYMQALSRAQSACPANTDPTLGSRMAWAHGLLCFEPHHAQTTLHCRANDHWPRGSPSAAHGSIHCPGHDVRSERTPAARPDHPRRLARRPSTRSPPGSPRPLARPPAAPGSSRPSREVSESILSTVRRADRPARRS